MHTRGEDAMSCICGVCGAELRPGKGHVCEGKATFAIKPVAETRRAEDDYLDPDSVPLASQDGDHSE